MIIVSYNKYFVLGEGVISGGDGGGGVNDGL